MIEADLRGGMKNSGKHIFVLGAGASHESANTPLGKDLVWNYHRDCAELLPNNNGKPDLSEENIQFSNFSEFTKLAASTYRELAWLPKEWKNRGWKVFDVYERLLKKHSVDEMSDLLQVRDDNKEGAKLVRQLIFEHIAQTSFNSGVIAHSNPLYTKFVKKILKNKAPQTTSVISLNFDCMLQGKEFMNKIYFDYLIDFDWIDQYRANFYRYNNPIPLIKLHGSLDWGTCENCGRLHLYYPSIDGTFYKNKMCTSKSKRCGGIVTPFIAIPYEKKEEKINTLWNTAKDHLREADRITVIGYSFPDYDKDVIELFRDSLDTNVYLEVIDKCRDEQKEKQTKYFEKRYKDLFPDIRRSIEIKTLDGFSDYLNIQGKL